MTPPQITIRLVLSTELGSVGGRLDRGGNFPELPTSFPDTGEGRIEAEKARDKFQEYVDKNRCQAREK